MARMVSGTKHKEEPEPGWKAKHHLDTVCWTEHFSVVKSSHKVNDGLLQSPRLRVTNRTPLGRIHSKKMLRLTKWPAYDYPNQ